MCRSLSALGANPILHLEWEQLADCALRFKSYSLVQRLGYLVDVRKIPLSTEARDRILSGVGKSTRYLGGRPQRGTSGRYDGTWHIVDKVPREELLAEIELR